MPAVPRPGKRSITVELPEDLDVALRAVVEQYPLGTITQHVVLAIRRHVEAPPRVTVPRLPPADVEAAPAGAKRRGRPPRA